LPLGIRKFLLEKKDMVRSFISVVAVAVTTLSVQADLVNPEVPSWQDSAGAQFYSWDSFSSPYGAPNFNDGGDPGALLFNFAQGALVTEGGNLYGLEDGLNIHVYGYGPLEQAVLNIASMGTEFDYDSVVLGINDGTDFIYFDYDSFAINDYVEIPGFGANVSSSFAWDISDYDGPITEWAFIFTGAGAHNVLDAVSVDLLVGAVPAPGALALIGLGAVSIRRRRS
jgi:hypothetical protein